MRLMLALLIVSLRGVSTYADAPAPPQGALYLGQNQMLEAAAPRQLSLNANVFQFAYGPSGLEIAYAGSETNADSVTQFIRLAGVRYGTTTTLLSQTFRVSDAGQVDPPDAVTSMNLGGWSADERYFLITELRLAPSPHATSPGDHILKEQYVVVDVGEMPMHFSYVSLPEEVERNSPVPSFLYWWSPDRTRLLFAADSVFYTGDKHYLQDVFCGVYDVAKGVMKPVPVAERTFAHGWTDNSHLLMITNTSGSPAHHFSEDINSGKMTEIASSASMPSSINDIDAPPTPAVSPKSATLSLEDEAKTATDAQKVVSAPYHALWVRRTTGPKPMSAMPVGLTPGGDDTQARWSPNGQQIAFVAHGDLFVTDITTRAATPKEKYLAGETLTCPEERDLAAENLKEIGLGILQYTQDYDENFPAQQGINDALKPYLEPDVLLSIGGHPFVYHAPANLALAAMDAPADTVLGTIALPCATVTLYADGHVKRLPPPDAAP